MEALNLAVFIFGIACLVVPFLAGLYFFRDRDGLGRRVAWMLFGESTSIMITLLFSYQSVDHGYNAMPAMSSAVLRVIIFLALLLPSVGLIHYLLDQLRNQQPPPAGAAHG